MPLKPGSSPQTREENFHELRHGKTFARTEGKFGRKRALKQMVAIELSNERKTGRAKPARRSPPAR